MPSRGGSENCAYFQSRHSVSLLLGRSPSAILLKWIVEGKKEGFFLALHSQFESQAIVFILEDIGELPLIMLDLNLSSPH